MSNLVLTQNMEREGGPFNSLCGLTNRDGIAKFAVQIQNAIIGVDYRENADPCQKFSEDRGFISSSRSKHQQNVLFNYFEQGIHTRARIRIRWMRILFPFCWNLETWHQHHHHHRMVTAKFLWRSVTDVLGRAHSLRKPPENHNVVTNYDNGSTFLTLRRLSVLLQSFPIGD